MQALDSTATTEAATASATTKMPRKKGPPTEAVTLRLSADMLGEIDEMIAQLRDTTGVEVNRQAVITGFIRDALAKRKGPEAKAKPRRS